MSETFIQIHPQAAAQILEQIEEHGHIERRLHKIIYVSKIHPNPDNLAEVALVRVTLYDFASDHDDLMARFMPPELYPVLFIVSVGPLQPDIPEDGLITPLQKLGPRALDGRDGRDGRDVEH